MADATTSGAGGGGATRNKMPAACIQPRNFNPDEAQIVIKDSKKDGEWVKVEYINIKNKEGKWCQMNLQLGDPGDGPELQPIAVIAASDKLAPGSGKYSVGIALRHPEDIKGMLRFRDWFYKEAQEGKMKVKVKKGKTLSDVFKPVIIEPDEEPELREDGTPKGNHHLFWLSVNAQKKGLDTLIYTYQGGQAFDKSTIKEGCVADIGVGRPLVAVLAVHHVDRSKKVGPIMYCNQLFVERGAPAAPMTLTLGGVDLDLDTLQTGADEEAAAPVPPPEAEEGTEAASGAGGSPPAAAADVADSLAVLPGTGVEDTGGAKRRREDGGPPDVRDAKAHTGSAPADGGAPVVPAGFTQADVEAASESIFDGL